MDRIPFFLLLIQSPSIIIVVYHLLRHAAVNTYIFPGDKTCFIGTEV